jgi:glycosyltransferase involved in cell wall biosynthesis
MTNHIQFTVAIPTFNGGDRLPSLLEKLQKQINTENINWEILVVDNKSTDNTAQLVKSYQENWQYPFPLRYCLEKKQGAGFARKRAIQETQSPLIGFLDDDNFPYKKWVANAYSFALKHPNAGAFGSQIHPDWEVEPPINFKRITPFLAITERGNLPLLYEPKKKILPPAAGLVIRHQAWLESVPDECVLGGRTNGNMLTGEDLEVLAYIQKSGWEIWYNPEMEIYHQIPHWRLKREYLIPFFRGIGHSRFVTRMLGVKPWQRPLALVAFMINDLRKIAIHLIKYRTGIKHDLVAACEMELFISSFFSPFFLLKNGHLKNDEASPLNPPTLGE